jgi:hypothetical protein
VVTRPGADAAAESREAAARVRALAPGEVEVEVREVAVIPLSAAGKHRFTRSDVAAARPEGAA